MSNWLIWSVVLLLSFQAFAQESARRVYLKSERDQAYVSVFRKPGMNWKSCPKNEKGECIDSMGWLDSNSKVWVTGPKVIAEVKDPYTGKMVYEEYYPVQFEYDRLVNETNHPKRRGPIGYVDAAFIELTEEEPAYPDPKKAKPSKSSGATCSLRSTSHNQSMKDAACHIEAQALEEAVNELYPKVGMCSRVPAEHTRGENIYDNSILQNLVRQKVSPEIKAEAGRPVTQKDLIAIDSLARTLYGEMASCYKHGLHYPMAVARIAINRAENQGQRANFIRGAHSPLKPELAKVVTSATQFSMWLQKLNGQANPALDRGLCPVTPLNVKMPNGPRPNAEEMAVWNQSVRIATEAVLFPTAFKARTERLERRYFYTSGMGSFYNMKKDSGASIEGARLSSSRCIEIWYKNQEEERKNKSKRAKTAQKTVQR